MLIHANKIEKKLKDKFQTDIEKEKQPS